MKQMSEICRKSKFLRSSFCHLLLFIVAVIPSYAQVQEGYVRTVGTKEHRGRPVPDASVKIKGNINKVLSDDSGHFHLPMDGKREGESYQLLNVIKSGYEFADKDFLCRRFAYSSKVPLEVVLISSAELAKQRQEIEQSTYETVKAKYAIKVDSLERELNSSAITLQVYRERLHLLQKQFDIFDAIIVDIADHYARTDYDKLDSLASLINAYIIEGDLSRADILIAQKGDLNERIATYLRHAETSNYARQMLDSLSEEIAKGRVEYERERDDIANDLYNKYTISISRLELEEAEKYILLRSRLDTTNIKWQYDAGMFLFNRTGQYEKAAAMLRQAALQSKEQYGGWGLSSAKIINGLAQCYAALGDNQMTASAYNDAMIISSHFKGNESVEVAEIYSSYATFLNKMGEHQAAYEHVAEAVKIKERFYGETDPEMFVTYNNMGMALYYLENYAGSLEYFNRCLAIAENKSLCRNTDLATCYNNLGTLYVSLRDYKEAEKYLNMSLAQRVGIWGTKHKDVANAYHNLGALYKACGDDDAAIDSYNKAYGIYREIYGGNTDAALSLLQMGRIYDENRDSECIRCYAEALEIYLNSTMNKNSQIINETANLFYNSYCNGVQAGIIEEVKRYRHVFDQFAKQYAVLMTVADADSPASLKGMRGQYILVRFNEWDMSTPQSFSSIVAKYSGFPKELAVYNDSGFYKYDFEDRIGARLELIFLGKDKVEFLNKEFLKWGKGTYDVDQYVNN